ncbi:MAG TPA: hypothetical protein VMU11_03045 [Verrucomicrobiae bacterium]|nr:hypothetical protein [Verrucomicrobiae bacterium]
MTQPKKPSIPKPPPRPWRRASFSFESADEPPPSQEREREVAKGLESIYLKGGKEDLKSMSHTRRSRALRFFAWLVGGCAALSALAWTGLILFVPAGPTSAQALQVTFDGPDIVGLGKEESFTVHWENSSYQPLKDVHVRLSLPPSMLVTTVDPSASDRTAMDWNLGLLGPGSHGDISVKGVFLGNLGEKNSLQAVATYRTGDSDKPQEALVLRPVTFGDTVLAGQFALPPKAVAGDTVTLEYDLANRGDQGLRGLRVRLAVPHGFTPSASSSTGFSPVAGSDDWEQLLGDFPAHATTSVKLVGQFVAGSAGVVDLQARAGVPKADGSFLPLLVSTSTLSVLAGDLGLHLVVNGSDGDQTIQPGDPLRLTLNYRDLSPEPLTDVRLTLSLESLVNGASATGTSLLDWNAIVDDGHGSTDTKSRIQTIRYSKDGVPAFAQLAPQEDGSVDITMPTLGVGTSTQDAAIRVTLEGLMATVGKDKSLRVIRTNPITLRYRSDVSVNAEARYFTEEGAPVGSGPLPPVVKKTTVYRVYWTVQKSLHALDGVQVSAVLPGSVAFGANQNTDAGTLAYDASSRTVTWSLNKMPENVDHLGAFFDIQLTPAEIDANRFADLLGETRLTANDAVVGEPVVRTVPPLTTDLENDENAKDKGVVRKK